VLRAYSFRISHADAASPFRCFDPRGANAWLKRQFDERLVEPNAALSRLPEAKPNRDTGDGALPIQTESANGDPVLTESPPVREVSEKAPRRQPSSKRVSPLREPQPTIAERLGAFKPLPVNLRWA
jgi:hypothetical protein